MIEAALDHSPPPRRGAKLLVGLAALLACALFAVGTGPAEAADRQFLETIGAIVVTQLISQAVGTAVAAAVKETIVMDVFNQRDKCYESYVAWPSTRCREG
jgi:hypothetical protein